MRYPNLRAEMARQGKTRNDLAHQIGKTRQTVSSWLLGKTEPRITEAQKIADWLGCPVEYLFED